MGAGQELVGKLPRPLIGRRPFLRKDVVCAKALRPQSAVGQGRSGRWRGPPQADGGAGTAEAGGLACGAGCQVEGSVSTLRALEALDGCEEGRPGVGSLHQRRSGQARAGTVAQERRRGGRPGLRGPLWAGGKRGHKVVP